MHDEVNPFLVTADGSQAKVACARCNHVFTSNPDGFVDADLENEIAAHQERCFVVGDWVRWDNPNNHYGDIWIEGELLSLGSSISIARIRASSGTLTQPGQSIDVGLYCAPLRRIPRPGQDVEQPTLSARLGHLKHGPSGSGLAGPCDAHCRKCAVEQAANAANDPTLYDGLSDAICYQRWKSNRHQVENGAPLLFSLTPAQVAVAKHAWSREFGASLSAQLRAKIAASREAERLTVRVELQCEEDFEW